MMNKSLRGCGRESSHKDFYGFHAARGHSITGTQAGGFASARRTVATRQKKSRRFRRLLK